MFGSTQGGRGVVVTVFADNDRVKEYAGTEDELDELFTEIILGFQGESQDMFAAYGIAGQEQAADD